MREISGTDPVSQPFTPLSTRSSVLVGRFDLVLGLGQSMQDSIDHTFDFLVGCKRVQLLASKEVTLKCVASPSIAPAKDDPAEDVRHRLADSRPLRREV